MSTDAPATEAPAEPLLGTPSVDDFHHSEFNPPTPSPTASYISTAPPTPALSTPAYDSSVPGTPFEHPAPSFPNPSLALDSPARELGHLSLASTPDRSPSPGGTVPHPVSGVGANAHRITDHPGATEHHANLAEAVLARTSAGQDALREGVLPGAKGLAGIPVPGPSTPSVAPGTPNLASSTAVTPGTSRVNTPVGSPNLDASKSVAEKSKGLMPPPASVHGRRPNIDGRSEGAPVKEGKKSVFGKLFERNNSSTASFQSTNANNAASSHSMERRGSGSAASAATTADQQHLSPSSADHSSAASPSALASAAASASSSATPPLSRRKSEQGQKRQEKEDAQRLKDAEKREKQERKDREKKEKEEQKERARSASRGRTPSQTGRPRADSSGAEKNGTGDKKGALDGAMDFMRIKVQRKTSVTSRRSDDGKSEKSVHLGGGGESAYGGSQKEETRSRGGQSNASLSKKYGVCDKVIVGKGATAVVRLAHKWDRTQEKLYAVKVRFLSFRPRRLPPSVSR